MEYIVDEVDVIVVGAGHAGVEAGLATARRGLKTIIFAINLDSIAMLPCNPSIGGTSKGHLVREIDALGGQMAKAIDASYIQSKMLNTAKGPAVHSLRAQADKHKYSAYMKYILENTKNLKVRQSEVTDILFEGNKAIGVKTISRAIYKAKAIILATGTYLRARCIYGDISSNTGPNGLMAANHLTDSLLNNGIEMLRFKTGTPARIDKKTIDFSRIQEQKGDKKIRPFSFENREEDIKREQISCYLTYTNEKTHEIINENLHRSPMFSGEIDGIGTRYCPSIEDKVVRFADKDRHQIFLEPEAEFTNEMYVQGLSSSLPEDVQEKMLRTIEGLEKAQIMRIGYAIEYDLIDPLQLNTNLSLIDYPNLFCAGQINGSSGYEEAAAQGIIAGINAGQYVFGKPPFILDRSQAYIGILIDDLTTKGTKEPYRMMTSRSEYRLLHRQDNADLRLTQEGYSLGLISQERYDKFLIKKQQIEDEIKRLRQTHLGVSQEINKLLKEKNSSEIKSGISLSDLLKRPELNYENIKDLDPYRKDLPEEVKEQVNIQLKYEGYIKKQVQQVEQFKKLEKKKIPKEVDFEKITNLRLEARQKLSRVRPDNIGRASRISGVSPADISVLLVYLDHYLKKDKKERKDE